MKKIMPVLFIAIIVIVVIVVSVVLINKYNISKKPPLDETLSRILQQLNSHTLGDWFESLKNLSIDDAVNKFWEPAQKDSFFVNDWLVEFRIALYNIRPPKTLKKQRIQIQEYTREKLNKNFTVWYALSWTVRNPVNVLERDKSWVF